MYLFVLNNTNKWYFYRTKIKPYKKTYYETDEESRQNDHTCLYNIIQLNITCRSFILNKYE